MVVRQHKYLGVREKPLVQFDYALKNHSKYQKSFLITTSTQILDVVSLTHTCSHHKEGITLSALIQLITILFFYIQQTTC